MLKVLVLLAVIVTIHAKDLQQSQDNTLQNVAEEIQAKEAVKEVPSDGKFLSSKFYHSNSI